MRPRPISKGMNPKKRKWANYVVGVLIVGLVMAYVPFLFSPQALQKEPRQENETVTQNQEANLAGAAVEKPATTTSDKGG